LIAASIPTRTCHVDNVIEAIECALERGVGGRAYFTNDQETQTFREFITMIANLKGLSTSKLRSMPYGLAFTLGRVMEIIAAITFRKSDPPLSRSMVRMIGREFLTNDVLARRELGYVGKTSRADGIRLYKEAGAAVAG
jgi:nucleoside-diphosphate-sugar epimerase